MDLKNNFQHNAGSMIQVDGTEYAIGADGIARNISQAHAAKLLQNKTAWALVAPVRTPLAEGKLSDNAPKVEPKKEEIKAVVAEPAKVESSKEDEWPDPKESMELDYLRQMATAYDVPYAAKTSKKDLVKKIKAAMYE